MKLLDSLAGVTAKHRSIVASTIGLDKKATAEEIAGCLLDSEWLAPIVAGLSSEARRASLRQALGERGAGAYAYYFTRDSANLELEANGLAFAFKRGWQTDYVVPEDLRGPLTSALMLAHASGLKAGRAERWLGAPLQLAHDVAALWAGLHREPARLKTDGELYQRAWPKLVQALPPLDLFGPGDALVERRVDAALAVLREQSCLRVRLDDANGWETRRELVPAGELAPALTLEEDRLRARILDDLTGNVYDAAGRALLEAVAHGGAVSLASIGTAIRGLVEEAGGRLDQRDSTTQVALLGLQLQWLVGLVEIGLDAHGKPAAVRERDPARASNAEREAGAPPGPRAVCQGNFEVVLLAPPTPAERLLLELACEPVAGQPHVYRITGRSVAIGERAGIGPGGVLGALRELAGELPQNVARSVADWAAGYGRPLRVRTAMMLDAGDSATADALAGGPLAGLVVERIGDSLLAVTADRLKEVAAALATAGRELEPGLDRISGRWDDHDRGCSAVEHEWIPRGAPAKMPAGKLVSTVSQWRPRARTASARPASAQPPPAPQGPARPAREREDPEFAGPLDVILDAIESDDDVVIVYAGARGVTKRQITPYEVEDAAVHAWCHLREDERSFWVASIRDATPVGD